MSSTKGNTGHVYMSIKYNFQYFESNQMIDWLTKMNKVFWHCKNIKFNLGLKFHLGYTETGQNDYRITLAAGVYFFLLWFGGKKKRYVQVNTIHFDRTPHCVLHCLLITAVERCLNQMYNLWLNLKFQTVWREQGSSVTWDKGVRYGMAPRPTLFSLHSRPSSHAPGPLCS